MRQLAVTLLALALLATPIAVETQLAGKVYTLGFLSLGSASGGVSRPLREALRKLGYVEGRNLVVEARFADADVAKLPDLAADLVRRRVDVIVTIGTPPVKAAKDATTTIPIVMAGSGDPVEHGLVASLAQPGGNVTGVTHSPGPDISGKGLEFLKEAVPTTTRVAVLWDSSTIHEKLSLAAQQPAARALGITLLPHDVQTLDDLQRALLAIDQERADSLFVFPNFINGKHGTMIVDFARTHRLPTMLQETWWVKQGGLMSYYSNWDRLREGAAVFVDKILKGAKPADLPVEQPTKFELVINLKTAKALGLTIPPSVLARADEVIE